MGRTQLNGRRLQLVGPRWSSRFIVPALDFGPGPASLKLHVVSAELARWSA